MWIGRQGEMSKVPGRAERHESDFTELADDNILVVSLEIDRKLRERWVTSTTSVQQAFLPFGTRRSFALIACQ